MPSLPDQMNAIAISSAGGPEVLKPCVAPIPRAGANQVLIAVHATSVNGLDVLQRQGLYPSPSDSPNIPGLDVAGIIAAVGPKVRSWRVGDPVCALVSSGAYAEYCVAPASLCLPIPENYTFTEAAVLPEVFFTAWANLFLDTRLKPRQTLLVHGGAGGVGTAAILLAAHHGVHVIAVAGNDKKAGVCRELGASRSVNHRTDDFVAAVKEHTHNRGVDVILDVVGAELLMANLRALAPRGRLIVIALPTGNLAHIDLLEVMAKQCIVTGSRLRPRPLRQKAAIARALCRHVWPALASRTIRPVIDRTLPLTNAAEAHRILESRQHVGKIALEVVASA